MWWIALVVVVPVRLAEAAIFLVGQDPDYCTHSSIQDALSEAQANGPSNDVIVVTSEINYTNQALDVGEQSVELWAGYTCYYPSYDYPVTLTGDGLSPVIRVQTAQNGRDTVVLRNLVLTGGGGARGGGLEVEGWVRVVLDGVRITDNTADDGGGIGITQFFGVGTGGIVELMAGSEVDSNHALAGEGGGIYVGTSSQLRIFPDNVLISQNTASVNGGGIAISGGSVSVGTLGQPVQRDDAQGLVVSDNEAGELGGGIYLIGATSVLDARETAIVDNTAGSAGGGIVAWYGATFTLSRDYPSAYYVQCPEQVHCSRLFRNRVTSTVVGAAIGLDQGARGYINQTEIVGHDADVGSVVYVGGGSSLYVEGALFTGNTTRSSPGTGRGSIIKLAYLAPQTPPLVRVAFSTFGGNTESTPTGPSSSLDLLLQQSSTMQIYSSAFYDSAYPEVDYGPAGLSSADCTVRTPGGAFTPYVTVTRSATLATPDFVGGSDYHLLPTSGLLDYCDTSAYAPSYTDLDLRPRCYDSGFPNGYGTCDVGAYELAPLSDLIFENGFE